jgi:HEAT repeat protein
LLLKLGNKRARWRCRRALLPLLALSALAGIAGASTGVAPHLRALVNDAHLVVRAEVTAVTPYDNGRILVADLRVEQTLKGKHEKGAPLKVMEMRPLNLAPALEAGRRVVVFLTQAQRNTYLITHLPDGHYFALVNRKPASLSADSAAEATKLAELVGRLVSMSATPERDPTRRAAQARTFTFDLLEVRHPTVVADGVASLGGLRDLAATLGEEEQRRLEAVLGRDDLPAYVRLALIRAAADNGLKQLVPALRRIQSPELLDASWEALSRLESAPARESVEEKLASPEPRVRTAAVQQLLREEKAGAVPLAVRLATSDPDIGVRVAATEALGEVGVPEAVPALETIYNQPEWETRQAVARALRKIGGRPAAEAFERLAFTAPPDAQRYAVVLLLLSGVERDDVLVQSVINKHPDPDIRHLAEHGLELHDH